MASRLRILASSIPIVDVFNDFPRHVEAHDAGAIEGPWLTSKRGGETPGHQANLAVETQMLYRECHGAQVFEHVAKYRGHGIDATYVVERVGEPHVGGHEIRKAIQGFGTERLEKCAVA
jgi:hypothetical protein